MTNFQENVKNSLQHYTYSPGTEASYIFKVHEIK